MPLRPVLSKYPRLHGLLRKDTQANADFNALLNEVVSSPAGSSTVANDLQEKLAHSEANLQDAIDKYAVAQRSVEKTVRFIRLLGELLEAQTNFKPYVEDIAEKRKYSIEFSPAQIRMALRLYWDVIGSCMENSISRTLIIDPAVERENNLDEDV